eukprot:gene17429-22981_t
MRITIIPLNSDNYGYLLVDESTNIGAIVDVSGQPEIVYEVIKKEQVDVRFILTTHKHWDHAGGNDVIKKLIPNIEVIGSSIDNVEGCTRTVVDNEEFYLSNIKIRCILTPGHTMGHVSYYVEHNNEKVCFTGDCLFVGGAGKFFEGSANDMYPTLYNKLGSLDPETKIYCGHEYTVSNYRFALSVDPKNPYLIEANEDAISLRNIGKPTVPSTLSKEFQTNPFLRVKSSDIQLSLCQDCSNPSDPIELLAAIRQAKNNFK